VALSLRTRLTAWYSVLLVLTVAVFSAAVLWLHWRLILEEFDEGLGSITSTAANVVEEELGEVHDLGHAATEMAAVVHPADFAVEVLDASGAPLLKVSPPLPLPAELRSPGFTKATETLEADDGRQWRVMVRGRTAKGFRYLVAVGAPLDEAAEQWRTLVRACLIGIPLALVFAAGGGLWLGRAGLRPLTSMAAEAHAITATTLDTRLSVPAAAELGQLARSFNVVLDRLGSALSTQRRFMADASGACGSYPAVRTAASSPSTCRLNCCRAGGWKTPAPWPRDCTSAPAGRTDRDGSDRLRVCRGGVDRAGDPDDPGDAVHADGVPAQGRRRRGLREAAPGGVVHGFRRQGGITAVRRPGPRAQPAARVARSSAAKLAVRPRRSACAGAERHPHLLDTRAAPALVVVAVDDCRHLGARP
jgi:HAMP domain-containing protein